MATYAYGMKGAPTVGKGLGGLPRRKESVSNIVTVPVLDVETNWIRPADWLPMPTDLVAEASKINGLFAVFDNDSNFVSFKMNGSGATYTVDWGDGSTENISTGTKAQHKYVYATCGGKLCSRGYKTVLVKIYSTTPGDPITSIDFDQQHSSNSVITEQSWLELHISGAGASQTAFWIAAWDGSHKCNMLENIVIYKHGKTDIGGLLAQCRGLQSATIDCTGCTLASQLFYQCESLKTVTLTNTSAITDVSSMFEYCASMRVAPLFNTTAVTTCAGMFAECVALRKSPAYDMRACVTFTNMFNNCKSLQEVDAMLVDITGTTFTTMFAGCTSLSRCKISGLTDNITFIGANLSSTEINEIYTLLGTANGAKTITISGNYGYGGATNSIATGKGWTVA